MEQRGRKSSEARATVSALPSRGIVVPGELTAEEAKVWEATVASKPVGWWDGGSTPLLVQYCRAAVQSDLIAKLVRNASETLETRSEVERYHSLRREASRLSLELANLATKMRLTQQARIHPEKAGTLGRQAQGIKPWSRDV